MSEFSGFINQIPNGVLQKTEKHLFSNIALFKPHLYMGGVGFNITDYHIVIPSEETPDAIINNTSVHGDKGKIMVVNPGDIVVCNVNAPAKPYYSFLVKAELLDRVSEEMGAEGNVRFKNCLNPFSFELLQALRCFDRESDRPDRLNLLLDSLEIQIAVILLRELETTTKTHDPLCPEYNSYVRLAEEYMHTYFSSNITLEDICEEIHVSCYHFIRIFKQKVGITPHQYLINLRIEKAKELLNSRDFSVTETAYLCGFAGVPHFSSAFKRATGYSPLEYKNTKISN